ncbi:MAG TPA: nuclear transport factor 2 family protein [Candidatus Acidoferrum sp.]|nr:nuclear transport factor 2 family protein [Candidatus Acidoferrum sp.]
MKMLVLPVAGGTAAKRITRLLFVRAAAALLAFWVAGSCLAGDAVFSNDGQRVYAIGNADNKQVLREINLSQQTSRTISLSQLPSQQPLLGITRSDGDKLFCVTEKNIWTFDPGSNRLTKVCGSPKGGRYWRIAYDPKSHTIVVTGTGDRGPLFLYKNGLVSVYVRRHNAISSPVFAADGTFFYSEIGDLWSGQIENNEGTYSLTADRYLPLAYLETANTTPAGMGVSDIAPVKDSIYVQLFRMGGSGWGAMFQVPRPPPKEQKASGIGQVAEFELTRWKELLEGLKPLGENDHPACLCASPDETRVCYTNEGKDYLITNGQTAELHLTKAAATANAQVSSTEPAPVATDVTPPSDTDIQYGIDVVQKQIAAMSARDVDTLVSLYGDNVDYLDKGNVSSDVVRKELQAYFDKWPVVKWEVKGVIQSRLVGQSNYNINFAVAFEVSDPATKKRVAGTATETEMLAPDASGNKKIISQHEKITTSHRSDGKPAKTEREKAYRGRPAGPELPWRPNIPWP